MSVSSWFLRIIGLCGVALLLAACSAVKLGYSQLPDVAYWWIDAYIDTSDAQTPRLRRELDEFIQWHRSSELPKYVQWLQKLQQLAPGSVSPEQVCTVFGEIRERTNALSARAQAPALWLAQSLKPEQLQHMERKYARNNSEWQSDWQRGTAAERLQRRVKQAAERYEMLYGNLSDAQVQLLRADLARSSYNVQTLWTERLRRQQDIIQTLRRLSAGDSAPEPAGEALHALLARLSTSPDPGYRVYSETTLRENCALFSRLHNSTTPVQRARALETLKNYESDFRALTASGR